MHAVTARGVTKLFGRASAEVHALRGINLEIEKGTFVAIMGPSGCGKSTLLSILGGLDSSTNGQVYLDGRPLSGLSETALAVIRRERIGFVFQSFNLIPVLTAEENVGIPLMLAGLRGKVLRTRVDRMIRLVGLDDRRMHYPSELSGGQQQRVAIARALVTEPALLLADEPTGNLDSQMGYEVMSLFERCCQELDQTVVVVTHDTAVAAWATRLLCLHDGLIVADHTLEGDISVRHQTVRTRLEEVTRRA